MPQSRQSQIGKLISKYAGRLDQLPELVRHIPIESDYKIRLEAINADLPQALKPREFLRFLLVDDPTLKKDPDRTASMRILEREIDCRTLVTHMLAPSLLSDPMPKTVAIKLESLTGKTGFWLKKSFSSSDAELVSCTPMLSETGSRKGFAVTLNSTHHNTPCTTR